jgi:hypothetical protein
VAPPGSGGAPFPSPFYPLTLQGFFELQQPTLKLFEGLAEAI